MTEAQLLTLIEEQVGRGRWFVPVSVVGWSPHVVGALVAKGRLERNPLARDDERRGRHYYWVRGQRRGSQPVYEYRLPAVK